ncbi:Uncharacterised protein [Yersinia enterocolitica]|nr:Uncharacterised protein [Yersinia enterocolitica]
MVSGEIGILEPKPSCGECRINPRSSASGPPANTALSSRIEGSRGVGLIFSFFSTVSTVNCSIGLLITKPMAPSLLCSQI